MKLLFLWTFIISSTYCHEKNNRFGSELGPVIEGMLNSFFGTLSGTALDPLAIFNMTIPTIPLPGGYLDAKIAFTEVKGMSNCRADNVEVDIQAAGGFIPVEYNGTMDMNFSLPILQVSGSYWTNGVLLSVLPIYGEGAYTIDIIDASFGGGGGITVNVVTGKLQMNWLNLRLSFSQLVTNFEGLLGGGDLGSEINEMISSLATSIINSIIPLITTPLSDAIVNFLNKAFEGINIWDIVPKP
ncbi:uncharacterized protein LOC136033967 [Artemia franciscana]|uniref:Uncharacterized protein n=1 Tax=Artemia franciscana TaxID=6661 RepID=A0AA88L9A8_ARTSF|nr:hypothetical protein QYM36_001740 [Artemia franciscana]